MKKNPPEIRRIVKILAKTYGNPRHGNKRNPLDELVYIILSNRTLGTVSRKTYVALKREFPSWRLVGRRRRKKIERILKPNGISRVKSDQIVRIMETLNTEFGRPTLSPLREWPDDETEKFLVSLPGVSRKAAKCVQMYSFDRPVLPVDVHVHRVASRIGLEVKKRPDASHDALERAVPPEIRYSFHVNALSHGRAVCSPRKPKCDVCPIFIHCQRNGCQRQA